MMNFITIIMTCLFSNVLSPTQQIRRSRAWTPGLVPGGLLFGALHRVICGDAGVLPLGTVSHKRQVFDLEHC